MALPLVSILQGVSSNGRYLGVSLILFTFPIMNMGLIMLPKMVAVHSPPKETRSTRGSSEGVRVSGIPSVPSSSPANSSQIPSASLRMSNVIAD